MTKLQLKAAPTFTAKVGIPVAGGASVPVAFTFKHRTRTQLVEFMNSRADQSDTDSFMEMVTAWDLEEPFSREAANELLENYGGAAVAVYTAYREELLRAKEKN